MDIDYTKAGTTTHMSCGTTNVGHYVIAQQGVSGMQCAKAIFENLSQYQPTPPGEGWKLGAIQIQDYKSYHIGEHYKVHLIFEFRKDHGKEKYIKEVSIELAKISEAYRMFQKAVNQ